MMTLPDFEKKQIIFVVLQQGEKISFRNDNLIIADQDGAVKLQTTCYRIFMLAISGSFTLTTGIIQKSHKFGFPIYLFTHSLKLYDKLGSKMEGNVLLRQQQYSYNELKIAVHLIRNKILNQLAVLKKRRQKSEYLKSTISKISGFNQKLDNFSGELSDLLAIEGNVARLYFKAHFDNVSWQGRKPRIKADYINSILDIGYTILFNMIDAMLDIYGFDVYCGVLHRQFYMRKSLVCDLVEPFRIIIDVQVKKSINLGQFDEKDFEEINSAYRLKWDCNKKYVGIILKALLEHKQEIFNYIQTYYRAFMRQKGIKDYPIFNWKEKVHDFNQL